MKLKRLRPNSIRGFSNVSLLIIDEAAQVLDESYNTARPMVAVSDGRIILLSTPHGRRGFFWDTWANKADWLKIEINADQCPRFTKDFLREEKETFPDWFFQQEYYNFFAEATSSVFKQEDIDRAFKPGLFSRTELDLSLDDL